MSDYDLIIRGGTVVTDSDQFAADIGISGGRIAVIGTALQGGPVMEAAGLLVLPGGVDSHCHIEQLQDGGQADEETFATGSIAALAGGTTTVVTFSTQFKGGGIRAPLAEYRRRAKAGAMVDYAFHQILSDPTDAVLHDELPEVVASGVRSLKVFMTYDALRVDCPAVCGGAVRRAPAWLPRDRALRELRRDLLAHLGAAGGRADGAEIPRLVAPRGGGAGGDVPRATTGPAASRWRAPMHRFPTSRTACRAWRRGWRCCGAPAWPRARSRPATSSA